MQQQQLVAARWWSKDLFVHHASEVISQNRLSQERAEQRWQKFLEKAMEIPSRHRVNPETNEVEIFVFVPMQ